MRNASATSIIFILFLSITASSWADAPAESARVPVPGASALLRANELVSSLFGIDKRDPVTIEREYAGQVVVIPDNQSGNRWYKIRLYRVAGK
jgi:hypothetical protein